MAVIDVRGDAERVFNVLKGGGIAIFPNDVGYALMGGSEDAVKRINSAKGRGGHKRNAFLCGLDTQRELHVLDERSREMIEAITSDYDLPLGAVAPFDPGHPMLRNVPPGLLATSTAQGTLAMLLNAGPLFREICRLSRDNLHPIFGSSANLTGTGPKFRVDDIQPVIREIADITVDYGIRKYHTYKRSATIIRFPELEVVRIGSCYELVADVLRRHFKADLPDDLGTDANPSGHLQEFALPDLSAG